MRLWLGRPKVGTADAAQRLAGRSAAGGKFEQRAFKEAHSKEVQSGFFEHNVMTSRHRRLWRLVKECSEPKSRNEVCGRWRIETPKTQNERHLTSMVCAMLEHFL